MLTLSSSPAGPGSSSGCHSLAWLGPTLTSRRSNRIRLTTEKFTATAQNDRRQILASFVYLMAWRREIYTSETPPPPSAWLVSPRRARGAEMDPGRCWRSVAAYFVHTDGSNWRPETPQPQLQVQVCSRVSDALLPLILDPESAGSHRLRSGFASKGRLHLPWIPSPLRRQP